MLRNNKPDDAGLATKAEQYNRLLDQTQGMNISRPPRNATHGSAERKDVVSGLLVFSVMVCNCQWH